MILLFRLIPHSMLSSLYKKFKLQPELNIFETNYPVYNIIIKKGNKVYVNVLYQPYISDIWVILESHVDTQVEMSHIVDTVRISKHRLGNKNILLDWNYGFYHMLQDAFKNKKSGKCGNMLDVIKKK